MKPIIIFFVLFFVTPIVSTQEITTVENFLTDYEVVWETEDHLFKERIYIGDDYFGISTPFYNSKHFKGDIIYKHYNKEGELLWSTESFDYKFWFVAISQMGNRVMIQHITDSGNEYRHSITDVYDENGEHLFSALLQDYYFKSSSTGKFYFSVPKLNGPDDILLLDENGNLLYQTDIHLHIDVLIEALDDSMLLIVDFDRVSILNAKTNEISFRKLVNRDSQFFYHTYSRKAEKILLWSEHKVLILDRSLEELNRIPVDLRIELVQIANDSRTLGLFVVDDRIKGQAGLFVRIVGLDGTLIDQKRYILPPGEGIMNIRELSYDDNYFIHRYTGSNHETKKFLQYRSAVFLLDPSTKNIVSNVYLDSWLFPFGDNSGFIEVNDESVRLWSIREENDKKD